MSLEEKSILYVEDTKELRDAVVEYLLDDAKVLHIASNGVEALELLKEHNDIDFIISDIDMPKMNGIELAKWAKKEYPSIPFAIITAYEHYRAEAESIGVDLYLLKPFTNVVQFGKLIELVCESTSSSLLIDEK